MIDLKEVSESMQEGVVNSKKEQYNSIDLLKFLMSFMVVAIHTNPLQNINYYLNFGIVDYTARLAVPFYFMCTGFLLFKKCSIDDLNVNIIKSYIFKLFRLYIIWTIIYLPIICYYNIFNSETGIVNSAILEIRDFFLTGSYWHLWYLPATMVAVFLVTILVQKKVKLKYILIISIGLYMIGLFAQSYFGVLKFFLKDNVFLWNSLKFAKKIFATTRNGVFFGFVFIALGALFSYKSIKLKMKYAISGFVLSMIFLSVEVFCVKHFNLALVNARDMYLFLVPSVYFLFHIILNIKLQGDIKYKHLRYIGILIFYNHMIALFIYRIIRKIVEIITGFRFENNMVMFCFTIILSIVIAEIIIRLSNTNKCRWLRTIY